MIGMEVDSLDEPVSEASIYHQMVLARYGGYYPTSKRNSDSSARASKCWPHALVGRREQPLPVGGIPEFFLVTKSAFYGRLREVTDAQRPLLPRPFAGEKKERKRDRQTRPGAKT